MQKHVRIYKQHFNYGDQDLILCENCGKCGIHIHHIVYKSQQGKDKIDNIMALCVECHDRAHFKKTPYLKEKELKDKHICVMIAYEEYELVPEIQNNILSKT